MYKRQVVDPEKLGSDPFIRQVMADVERATGTDALETYTTKGCLLYTSKEIVKR